ncbi:MAG: arsenic resistance protein, partial [Planctomycetota bacterium]
LLYATFVQVPILHLGEAARDRRYLAAALVANFVGVPAVVWALGWLVPRDPAILLGLYMVLLVPCTDWFIVFTQLGRGDARRAITSTPVMLLAQVLLLPVYLWLFLGPALGEAVRAGPFLQAFLLLILGPLLAAAATQAWAERRAAGRRMIHRLAWLPVPCLAVVLFLIAFSQAGRVADHFKGMERILGVFVLYLILSAAIGLGTARVFRLPPAASRTLIFSTGTRNSFVVLPLVLALPAGWESAVTVVVLQPLVELVGMLAYLRWVPRWTAV